MSVPIKWVVWMDPFNEEALAVEESAMTEALSRNLSREKVTCHTVSAAERRQAIEQAFPDYYKNLKAERNARAEVALSPSSPRRKHSVH